MQLGNNWSLTILLLQGQTLSIFGLVFIQVQSISISVWPKHKDNRKYQAPFTTWKKPRARQWSNHLETGPLLNTFYKSRRVPRNPARLTVCVLACVRSLRTHVFSRGRRFEHWVLFFLCISFFLYIYNFFCFFFLSFLQIV